MILTARVLVTTGVTFRKSSFDNRCVLKTEIIDLTNSRINSNILDDFTCRGGISCKRLHTYGGGSVGGLLKSNSIAPTAVIYSGYNNPFIFHDCFMLGMDSNAIMYSVTIFGQKFN